MSQNSHPPIGKLVNIGNHRLHIHSTGEGSPTVVLESGGASWSLDWHLVQTEIAKFTSVCSYDRAGFGWSDSGPTPRTSRQIVTELHTLLTKAEIKKPYILVGASFGGHTARLFAKEYPAEVAGIVLLDARHETINSRMPPAWKNLEAAGKGMYQFMLLASKLGVLNLLGRLMGEKAAPPAVMKIPREIRSTYLEVGFQPSYFQSNLDELAASAESDQQVSAAGSLGSLPLTVIRHGIPDLFARMPAEQAKQSEQVWQELQADLAKLSSNSQILIAQESGHGIQLDQPGIVVDAVRQMVETVRRDSPSTQEYMLTDRYAGDSAPYPEISLASDFSAPAKAGAPQSNPSIDLLREFKLSDVPEFQRFQSANPNNEIDSWQTAIMYGRAIHWLSFLDIIYPDFKKEDCVFVEVAYIVDNDPDREKIPPAFYKEIVHAISMLWELQLKNLYPNGDWTVEIFDDIEMTVQAHIKNRNHTSSSASITTQ